MPNGNDVAANMRDFATYGVRQGTVMVSANKFGYVEYLGPDRASPSGIGYYGVIPSGNVIEGKLTDRFDNITYY
jgi:hypothetical protein